MPDQPTIIDSKSEIVKNRGGAPKGNLNALKHGFYTCRFQRDELRSLDANSPKGVSEEIAMLRLLIRRQVAYTNELQHFSEYDQAMRTLCFTLLTLNRLLRTQLIIGDSRYNEFNASIDEALKRLATEWKLDEED